ncbi:hypothetical protein ABFS83_12G074500 [Erythranthe nasuta]
MNTKIAIICVLVLVVIVGDEVGVARAQVSCNPLQLGACLTAVFTSVEPADICCSAIRQATIPCLCQYLKDFINPAAALRLSTSCASPFPTDCP